jgi:hypothetical protein
LWDVEVVKTQQAPNKSDLPNQLPPLPSPGFDLKK